jgi:4-amino-4-deoxychorismate lyase
MRADIDTAVATAPSRAVLKIVVTRGSAVRRGYAPGGTEIPRPIVSLWKAAALTSHPDGVNLVLASLRVADQPALAGIKHLNRLENVLAARQAQEAGAFEALMLGADDRLVSGAMSNLFIVKSGRISTPFVDRAGVAGVMRGIVLRECAALGLDASEEHLTLEDLFAADGAFITNARLGVVPVGHVGEHAFRMNELAQRLAAHVESLDA